MLLRRRYRLYTVLAVVMVFMLYRIVHNSWEESYDYDSLRAAAPVPDTSKPQQDAQTDTQDPPPPPPPAPLPQTPLDSDRENDKPPAAEDINGLYGTTAGEQNKGIEIPALKDQETDEPDVISSSSESAEQSAPTADSGPSDPMDEPTYLDSPSQPIDAEEPMVLEKNPPNENLRPNDPTNPQAQRVHWQKPKEFFPIPEGSMRTLPVGKSKKIPKIQYDFAVEPEDAKATRVQRLQLVKKELERAWGGYRKYAWMHDELSPVSKKFRDPFCGWAATLVDSLDTLWIADLKDEFDEAVNAVMEIDFTWTPRGDIPVFETTIRYLGGLLAAFDVSGGHDGDYPVLLEKATELGEILMGIFDTPNRMPMLYYRWQPQYTSQPHRAGIAGIAELATLSMEFTRLAQLTGKQKYYDAIDRITDGLVDMQAAGTTIPGLFPERIDTSGCNKTATTIKKNLSKEAQAQMDSPELQEEPMGYTPSAAVENAREAGRKAKSASQDKTKALDEKLAPNKHVKRRAVDAAIVADAENVEDFEDVEEVEDTEDATDNANDEINVADLTDDTDATGVVEESEPEETSLAKKQAPKKPDHPMGRTPPFAADGSMADWDCEPQGLTSGSYGYDSYSMGGSQDSAYEYFPKQYLLLGGLEPKYQKLHEDTIDAINEWLLFRPMIKDEGWDILFPAKVNTAGDPDTDLTPTFEMTHLTCFIGGMYGLGGKIFGREDDIETAKKLTDGCVWAYQSTPSGVMPEWSHLIPCPTLDECEFNETLWWEHLDPNRKWREKEVLKWEADEAAGKHKTKKPLSGSGTGKANLFDNENVLDNSKEQEPQEQELRSAKNILQPVQAGEHLSAQEVGEKSDTVGKAIPASDSDTDDGSILAKRDNIPAEDLETSLAVDDDEEADEEEGSALPDSLKDKLNLNHEDTSLASAQKVEGGESFEDAAEVEIEDGSMNMGGTSLQDESTAYDADAVDPDVEDTDYLPEIKDAPPNVPPPSIPNVPWSKPPPMDKPLSHEEFVKQKLASFPMPPGYSSIGTAGYILRPEAIESVWYMYRITGDPTWMDKGWRMFEATVAATRTELANSAIDSVLSKSPQRSDEMESFWIAETLKYYYLLFSEPDVISLDEWVLNTEAHPFRRPS